VQRIAQQRAVTVTANLPPGPVLVKADPVWLRLVTLSLLDNAIKYNRPDGAVTVDLRTEGSQLLVNIKDTGEGIAPEHMDRIFDRFYRVDRARSRETGGVGLGLAIARRAVDLLGGTLELNSRPGEGTTATVRLNAAPA